MMKSKILLKLLLLLLFFSVNIFAIDGKIRVYVKAHDTIYTSQKVTIAVELLTDAFSISDARINFPSSEKYIVQAPQSADYINKEDINGTAWQVVHYMYHIYALRAGEIEIPSIAISFSSSMGYGQAKKAFDLRSEALRFNVKVPKGIKSDQFVLVSDSYALNMKLSPQKKQLIIGDAIELEIKQKAHDIPDILFQPIIYKTTDQVRVYTKEPLLESGLKGAFDVSRTDKYTLVANAEGNVSIAAQKVVWWDSKSEKVKVETLPGISFEIVVDPQIAIDAKKAKQKQTLIYILVLLALLSILYMLLAPYLKKYRVKQKQIYEKSEESKYDNLVNSIEKEDVSLVYRDFYAWLSMNTHEVPLNTFKDIYEVYPELKSALLTFEETLIDKNSFDKSACLLTIKTMRRTFQNVELKNSSGLENSLNP